VIPRGRGDESVTTAQDHADEARYEFNPDLWEEMMTHPGKWVVATESRVIAVGDDPEEVLRIAGKEGVDQPLLFHVPEDPSISFLL
jgi:hypothetical protein